VRILARGRRPEALQDDLERCDPDAAAKAPLFSCLCVTEDRPAFMPWLLWNFDKQDYEPRELVVVDSSLTPQALPSRPDLNVVRCPYGTGVAAKRNLALASARGAFLTWFDDDDWQHPGKLTRLGSQLAAGCDLAGGTRSWFVDLAGGRARECSSRAGRRRALAGRAATADAPKAGLLLSSADRS